MPYLSNISKSLVGAVFLSLLVTPSVAHNIKVSGDVAGTWHIEPNHSPKAGETARAWIALTRKGGKIIPLEQANCQMAVYSQPRKPSDLPVLQPTVKEIASEKYQGIPSADIIFPQVGAYQLELSCTPISKGSFKPFQMQYEVTVASGTAATQPVLPTQQPVQSITPANQWLIPAMTLAGILGLGGLAVFLRR